MLEADCQQPGDTYLKLASIEGPAVADSLIEFFEEHHNVVELEKLMHHIDLVPVEAVRANTQFTGKTMVFTGNLEAMTRNEAKAIAERLGAKIASSVSSRTDLVVAGSGAGSKLDDARKHGVQVIDEAAWLKLMQNAI